MSERGALRTLLDAVMATLFIVAISAPLAWNLAFGEDAAEDLIGSRKRAPRPSLPATRDDVETFPAAYEAWLDDSFGLRSHLVRAHNAIKVLGLEVAPSERMVVGKDGWIFADIDLVLESHRGLAPFRAGELEAWRVALEERVAWLESLGIKYLLVHAPNKHTIYEDKLPDQLRRIGEQTRYEEWIDFIRAETPFRPLDLREPLRRERDAGRLLYYPLGTHWNLLGAFVGYREIVSALGAWFPALRPLDWDDVTIREIDDPGDSWAKKMLIDDLMPQPVYLIDPVQPFRARSLDAERLELVREYRVRFTVTEHPDKSLPTAVMFHDSFAPSLMELLSEHFSRIVYVWRREMLPDVVLRERPDVVIQENVERFIRYRPERLPVELRPEVVPVVPRPGLEQLKPFAGTYVNPLAGDLSVELTAAGLVLVRAGRRTRLHETAPDRFRAGEAGVVFERDGDGRIVRARHVGDSTYTAIRRMPPRREAMALARFEGSFVQGEYFLDVRFCGEGLYLFSEGGAKVSEMRWTTGSEFGLVEEPHVTVVFGPQSAGGPPGVEVRAVQSLFVPKIP